MAGKWKLRSKRRLIAVGLVVFLCYAMITCLQNYNQYRELLSQKVELNARMADMQQQKETLQSEIAFTQTDAYIEQAARELLGWVKPGEIRFVEQE